MSVWGSAGKSAPGIVILLTEGCATAVADEGYSPAADEVMLDGAYARFVELGASSDVDDEADEGPMWDSGGLKSPASELIEVAGMDGIEYDVVAP